MSTAIVATPTGDLKRKAPCCCDHEREHKEKKSRSSLEEGEVEQQTERTEDGELKMPFDDCLASSHKKSVCFVCNKVSVCRRCGVTCASEAHDMDCDAMMCFECSKPSNDAALIKRHCAGGECEEIEFDEENRAEHLLTQRHPQQTAVYCPECLRTCVVCSASYCPECCEEKTRECHCTAGCGKIFCDDDKCFVNCKVCDDFLAPECAIKHGNGHICKQVSCKAEADVKPDSDDDEE